jgi:hypothetical protein
MLQRECHCDPACSAVLAGRHSEAIFYKSEQIASSRKNEIRNDGKVVGF